MACNDPSLITIREFFADTIDNASRLQMGELTTRFAGVRQQRKCDRTDVAVVEKVLGPILGLVLAYTKEARDNEFFTMEQLLDVFGVTYRMTRFRGALENRFKWSSPGSLEFATWKRVTQSLTAFDPSATSDRTIGSISWLPPGGNANAQRGTEEVLSQSLTAMFATAGTHFMVAMRCRRCSPLSTSGSDSGGKMIDGAL